VKEHIRQGNAIAVAKAVTIDYPPMEVELDKMKKVDFIAQAAGAKLIGYIALKVTLSVKREGPYNKFNPKDFKTEIASAGRCSLRELNSRYDTYVCVISNTETKFTELQSSQSRQLRIKLSMMRSLYVSN